jgi:alkylation response protein AidB-like acyl-CoA dehydrogenase
MDLHYSAEDLAFRDEVRSFLETSYPDHLRSRASRDEVTKQDFLDWQKILYNRGWGAPAWPKEYGGTGWSSTQKYIFQEECARAETLGVPPFGMSMLAPVLMPSRTRSRSPIIFPASSMGRISGARAIQSPARDRILLRSRPVRRRMATAG